MLDFIQTTLDVLILAPAVLAGVILLTIIIGLACAGANIGQYLLNQLIALDQGINTLLGGSPDETISAVAYRKGGRSLKFGAGRPTSPRAVAWRLAYRVINLLFFWQTDHCKQAFETEKRGGHLHPSYQE